jgi:hypothetical protein
MGPLARILGSRAIMPVYTFSAVTLFGGAIGGAVLGAAVIFAFAFGVGD